MSIKDIRGAYDLSVNGNKYDLNIGGEIAKPKITLKKDSTKVASKINYKEWLAKYFLYSFE